MHPPCRRLPGRKGTEGPVEVVEPKQEKQSIAVMVFEDTQDQGMGEDIAWSIQYKLTNIRDLVLIDTYS